MRTDSSGHPAHLHAHDVTFAITSRAPFEKLERFRQRLGWEHPWYSWGGGDFGVNFGSSPPQPKEGAYQDREGFGLSVFLLDAGEIYPQERCDQSRRVGTRPGGSIASSAP
jgi:predicted dithiol-disulfide oxidoreductase (DUF899 family)